MNILITICARGGSKGLPKKNIKLLNNKPLIGYSIEQAKFFQKEFVNTTISLSTDSEEIKQTAKDYGLETDYTRPDSLSTDTAGKLSAIEDLLHFEENRFGQHFDYIIDFDVTSPMRTFSDIKEALALLQNDLNALNIFSVSPAHSNPYFNMVEQKENGYYSLVKHSNTLSRQQAPKVYDMNASFYIYRRAFFDNNVRSAISEKSLIYLMDHACFDIDSLIDFEFMEYLLTNNKIDFL